MSDILSDRYWVIPTRGVSGTLVISATFIFLAYFLHPVVESSYHRVRAYRAWRAIEKRQAVEITHCSMMAEILGGRGKWDAARITAALLAVFSLASWGLELSMDLAPYEGVADLLNRPPPVEITDVGGAKAWKVKSRDDLQYDGEWLKLPNMFEMRAKSRYTLQNSSRHTGGVNGDIIVAYWYSQSDEYLFYHNGENATTVDGLNCTDGGNSTDSIGVYDGHGSEWGTVFTCERGPSLKGNLPGQLEKKNGTPPTIIMKRKRDNKVFLIVEESSSNPSFMYSIWTVEREYENSTDLQHEFHVSATMRLAEAVVTGIVHNETTGGGCFGLLRQHSEIFRSYDIDAERAFPFGECPVGDSKANIEDKETIEYGLKISADALLCFVWVMLLTSVSILWSVCLRSSIDMDVYDRDEIIRTVAFHGVAPGVTPPSDIRIFVRKEDTGIISVVISDTGMTKNVCARFLREGGQMVEDIDPSPVAATVDQYNHGFGGVNVPVGPRTVWLGGVRTGMSRALPGRNGNFHYPTSVALGASPVPSYPGSMVSTPIHSPSRRAFALRGGGARLPEGKGASVMFDSNYSHSGSTEETPNGMQMATINGSTLAGAGPLEAHNAPVHSERLALFISTGTSASGVETPTLSPLSPESKPPERRNLTRDRRQLGPLSQDSEEDTEESTCSSENQDLKGKNVFRRVTGDQLGINSAGHFPTPVAEDKRE